MLLLSAQKSEADWDYDGTWCEIVDPAAHLRIDHLRELSLNLASCINQCWGIAAMMEEEYTVKNPTNVSVIWW